MKKILIICISIVILSACDITSLNVDTKNPTNVPAGALFANSTVELFDYMVSTNVNENNLRLWSQYWTQTTYTDESNYELIERNANGRLWNKLYATVIRDARAAKAVIQANETLLAEEKRNQSAMCDLLEVYSMHVLVDLFGNVPYSEALMIAEGNVTPAYDDAKSIYTSLLAQLATISDNLSGNSGMGANDVIYGGDVAQWKKFANSLRLRLAIRLADTDATAAKAAAEAAITAGVFTSMADDFELAYQDASPNTNPVWEDLVQSGRSDFVVANTIVDYMNTLDDPRRDYYFTKSDGATDFVGGTYGASNSFASNSRPGTAMYSTTNPGTLLDYTEVEFLLADAAARGYAVTGTAEDHYNAGIENSIMEWGGTATDATTYLAKTEVAYATATGDWKAKIGFQKWLAMYNRGFEGYATYRVYDAPVLNMAAGVGTLPPTRFTYPTDEYSLNKASIEAAATTIGGDLPTTKIFWDAN
jgi:hypothetical protein